MGHDKGPQVWATNACMILRDATLLVIVAFGALLEIGVAGYLREHPGWFTVALLLGAAMLLAGVAAFMIPKFIHRKPLAMVLQLILLAVLIVVPASAWTRGGISSARYGWTVVGWCPIPVFDLQFREDGRVWFRNKSHRVTADEIRGLAEPGVEIIVIGTGWDPSTEFSYEAVDISNVKIEPLKNAEALKRYRELKDEGRKVALILHTTC